MSYLTEIIFLNLLSLSRCQSSCSVFLPRFYSDGMVFQSAVDPNESDVIGPRFFGFVKCLDDRNPVVVVKQTCDGEEKMAAEAGIEGEKVLKVLFLAW